MSAWLRNNVLGLVAIFIALSGSAYAANVARNSVGSAQIKAGAVKTSDLARNSVKGPKVANSSLTGAHVADNSLTGADVNEGSLSGLSASPTGPAGGELAGTYPNPTLGTVAGLDLAPHNGALGGINFGGDVDLYRAADEVGTYLATNAHVVSQLAFEVTNPANGGGAIGAAGGLFAYPGTNGEGGFLDLGPATSPLSSANPNGVRIYARTVSGTEQLIAVFNGDDVVVLASDPNP